MRSYYAHLETTADHKETAVTPRPIYRSSAIFPVMQSEKISTRVIFLGYWLLKRQIREVSCLITLRSEKGEVLSRRALAIADAKTYRIEAEEELERAGHSSPFVGSLEVEFFSSTNLVFPYPAVAVNYYGKNFSSVVHTAQRVYNDFEDMLKNSATAVPESGFNIYDEEDKEPFLSFINGPKASDNNEIRLQFFNHAREVLEKTISVGSLTPYQTVIVYPAREIPLKSFLNGHVGACKTHFKLDWIFPRLLVGNIEKSTSAVTITHTYYDCTKAISDSDYWKEAEPGWNPASLMVPLTGLKEDFTNIYFYPIYSPSTFSVDLEIYQADGKLLGTKHRVAVITSPKDEMVRLPLKEICHELGIIPNSELAARIIAHPSEHSRLPARIKLGLDIGTAGALPCNICTNLQPFNPQAEAKPFSFKWAPILSDYPQATVWIMNSSPRTHYDKVAEVEMTFFRENDTEILKKKLVIPPQGFVVIHPDTDEELKTFLQGKIGWITVSTTNAFTTTYYFSTSPDGIVGGDHGF